MSVRELIKKLEKLNQDLPVFVGSSDTYPAGDPIECTYAKNAEWDKQGRPVKPFRVVEILPL